MICGFEASYYIDILTSFLLSKIKFIWNLLHNMMKVGRSFNPISIKYLYRFFAVLSAFRKNKCTIASSLMSLYPSVRYMYPKCPSIHLSVPMSIRSSVVCTPTTSWFICLFVFEKKKPAPFELIHTYWRDDSFEHFND